MIGVAFSFVSAATATCSHQLRRAVMRDQLQLVYQPIVVLSTRQIVGAEALARWTDEEGNVVDPEVFVRLAEEKRLCRRADEVCDPAALSVTLQRFSRTGPDSGSAST